MIDNHDVDILCEALEEWEQKGAAGHLMGDLFGALLTNNNPEMKAKAERDREETARKRAAEVAARKRTSVMLRAKLMQMRTDAEVAVVEREMHEVR